MKICVRAALALAVLLFLPGLLEQFEAPKAEVVRVFGIAALAALGVLLVTRRPRRLPRWAPLDLAVLAWLAVELLATFASVSPSISFFGDTKQSEGLLTSLGLSGLYFAARCGSPAEANGTLTVTLIAGGLAAAYAVLQALGLDPTPWSHIATYERAGPFMRPFGTLGHPNVLGVVTAAGAASCAALAIAGRRYPWGALAILFAAVTAVTLSRGAWLGAASGAAVASALALRERGASLWRTALLLGGAAVLLVVGLGVAGFGPTLLRRLAEIVHPESGSARSRLEIWRIAWRAWQAHPWLGVGPDAFELTFQRYQTPAYWRFEWATVPAHAHSIFLHALATRGCVGAAAGLALLVAGLHAARAAWREKAENRGWAIAWIGGAIAMVVAGGFGALGIAGAAWLAVAGGSLVALAKRGEAPVPELGRTSERKREPLRSPGVPREAVLAGAIAGLAIAVFAATQLLASRASFEALDWAPRFAGDGDPDRALRAALRAVRLAPFNDQAQYYRAQALLRVATATGSVALLDPAERAARIATTLEPERAIDYQCLASVYLARARAGDRAALDHARAAFAEASAQAPYNALLWLQLADAEISLGHAAEALPRIRRALALYPDAEVARAMLERASAAAPKTAPPG